MYRVGDVFREPPEVRQCVLEMIEEYDAAKTLQDIEPSVSFARGHGIPVPLRGRRNPSVLDSLKVSVCSLCVDAACWTGS